MGNNRRTPKTRMNAGIILFFNAPYRYLDTGHPLLRISAPKSEKIFPSATPELGYSNPRLSPVDGRFINLRKFP
jgi:hypothetical protein